MLLIILFRLLDLKVVICKIGLNIFFCRLWMLLILISVGVMNSFVLGIGR